MLAPLLLAALAAAPDHHEKPAAEDGVTVLFDGSNLDAWERFPDGPIPEGWEIDGDALHFTGEGGDGKPRDIQTKQAFEDFDLRFEFKVAEGANSGVIYGISPEPKQYPWQTGPEYQILDGRAAPGRPQREEPGRLAVRDAGGPAVQEMPGRRVPPGARTSRRRSSPSASGTPAGS